MTQLNASVWWKVPMVWMLVALPLTAVVAGLATVMIAFQNQDGLVTDDVRKLGFTTTQISEREAHAARLNLAARLEVDDNTGLLLTLTGQDEKPSDRLTLRLVHPTQVGKDLFVSFSRVDPGHYSAPALPTLLGKRLLVLEPADQSWRLTGIWPAEFRGSEISLAAAASNPPPHQ